MYLVADINVDICAANVRNQAVIHYQVIQNGLLDPLERVVELHAASHFVRHARVPYWRYRS